MPSFRYLAPFVTPALKLRVYLEPPHLVELCEELHLARVSCFSNKHVFLCTGVYISVFLLVMKQ